MGKNNCGLVKDRLVRLKLESVRKRLQMLKDDPSLKTRYMVSGEGIFVKF